MLIELKEQTRVSPEEAKAPLRDLGHVHTKVKLFPYYANWDHGKYNTYIKCGSAGEEEVFVVLRGGMESGRKEGRLDGNERWLW